MSDPDALRGALRDEKGTPACSWFYDFYAGKRCPRNGTEQVTYVGDDGATYTDPFCGLHAQMILKPSDARSPK